MDRARAITVSFTSQPVLTIQTEPPNLRFKLDGNEILAPQVQTAGYITLGQNHTLSASAQQDCRTLCTAGTRYLFQDFADSAALTRTINWDGKSNVTYTLRFRTQHQQTFVAQNSTRGAVSVEARPADDYYDEGSTVKLTATPAAGNRFVSWQNGLLSTDLAASVTASVVSSCGNPWLFAVTQPLTLYGSFAAPVTPAPKAALLANGVVNTASGQGLAVSPGAIFALYGTDLGPAALKAVTPGDAGYFDNCAAGTSVTFDGIPAPMIYASPTQLGAIAPYAVAGKAAVDVQVRNQGVLSNTVRVPVQAATPALFTANGSGTGQGAIFNQDGSLNGAANAAARGSIVVLFATGEGQTNPAGTDGWPSIAIRNRRCR